LLSSTLSQPPLASKTTQFPDLQYAPWVESVQQGFSGEWHPSLLATLQNNGSSRVVCNAAEDTTCEWNAAHAKRGTMNDKTFIFRCLMYFVI